MVRVTLPLATLFAFDSSLLLSPFLNEALVEGAVEELPIALDERFVAVASVAGLPPASRAIWPRARITSARLRSLN